MRQSQQVSKELQLYQRELRNAIYADNSVPAKNVARVAGCSETTLNRCLNGGQDISASNYVAAVKSLPMDLRELCVRGTFGVDLSVGLEDLEGLPTESLEQIVVEATRILVKRAKHHI